MLEVLQRYVYGKPWNLKQSDPKGDEETILSVRRLTNRDRPRLLALRDDVVTSIATG